MSREISRQIDELTGGIHAPILEFLPSYRRDTFADMPMSDHASRPFRVLFAGRIEANKGVFDLLEIAENVSMHRSDIVFEIAGEGGAMAELRQQTAARKLGEIVHIHGYCHRPQMRELLRRSHVVIIPTRSDFEEGFNQVVAEAVLSGRPFITSNVCPALEYVREAGIEVAAEDIDGYAAGIERLADNADIYNEKCEACEHLSEQFFDESRSWAAALRTVLIRIKSNNKECDAKA
jgi:glycosyltransferase involved in cell wall biosynthesis